MLALKLLVLIFALIKIGETCKFEATQFFWSSIYQDRKKIEQCGLVNGSPWPWMVSLKLHNGVENTNTPRDLYTRERVIETGISRVNELQAAGNITNEEGAIVMNSRLDAHEDENKIESRCGAVLISDQWLVTESHCFGIDEKNMTAEERMDDPKKWYADFGEQSSTGTQVNISKILPTTKGENDTYNELVLIKLAKPIEIDDQIKPICLHMQGYNSPVGTKCETVGWKATSKEGKESKLPIAFPSTIIEGSVCNATYRPLGLVIGKEFTPVAVEMCTERTDKKKFQDNWGGALVCKDDERYYLEGIVSRGLKFKQQYPDVSINIDKAVMTIYKTIAKYIYSK